MNITSLLEMVASIPTDEAALVCGTERLTAAELLEQAGRAAGRLRKADATALVHITSNDLGFPVGLFGAAWAGVPLVPLNYRLADEQLVALVGKHPGAVVVTEPALADRLTPLGIDTVGRERWLHECGRESIVPQGLPASRGAGPGAVPRDRLRERPARGS